MLRMVGFLGLSGLNKLVSEPKPRWNVDKDDWDLFAEVFESKIGDSKPTGNVDRDFVTYRRAMTLRAIPRGKVFNYSASYKDPEVREAVSKRQSASEAYRLNPTVENHAADKKARERAERLTCKAQTCKERLQVPGKKYLLRGEKTVVNEKDIADTLASHYERVSTCAAKLLSGLFKA
ncbi:hypothetical protein Pmar_PMAR021971 [Perkinsus marinus ATCC 50983]|uniref:Uncharacterized protein n=1 Tax=Perkinsus marinus (strain ATCC 50983 / TXsc) TaxID=423536 RepID=C5LRP1_PERM5|nr:hypothetical protein Pmar_PMAR021971 [Perkinsus marinus ATCC 50983]EER00600.1 hypothetical protein Pmar_PMAR021971 [Perkinsus marinus ATCC 50983]|eukprot:XP_002767882.1 hypothetical protein Pmar_PMAR021971 [Perkinsus marinus ATCC 50983]